MREKVLIAASILAVTLAACSSGTSPAQPSASGSTTSAGWTFTDDIGETVTLGAVPETIVAQEDAANALAHFGIPLAGIFGGAPLDDNPQLTGVDVTGVEPVGEVWGEVDLEKLAVMDPDLIVTLAWDPPPLWGFANKAMERNTATIAPIVAIDATRPASEVIERFGELAEALGADLGSGDLAADRARFDAAFDELEALIADAPGLTVMVVSAEPDTISIAVPAAYQDLVDYQALGMDLVDPASPQNPYYETLSWEQADTYPADMILYDDRSYVLGPDDLAEIPTWNALPAVQADQIGPWQRMAMSYEVYADQVDALITLLEGSDPGTV